MKHLTDSEIGCILYCMESMAIDFRPGDDSTPDFESAFARIESLADTNASVYIFAD